MTITPGISSQQCLQFICSSLEATNLYYGHGTDNAWDEACWLLDSVQRRFPDKSLEVVNEQQARAVEAILQRRVREKKPLAYLINEAWFAGLQFYVDERVLVPRSPIAELIDNQFEPLLARPPARILDLCCGSGCIGIACALAFPEAQVELSDISEDALEVARINVRQYQLDERVKVLHSDLFNTLEGTYDLIVSNPPYVSAQEHAELPPEYLEEPRLGLVSEEEGMAIPRAIMTWAGRYLTASGTLVLEAGYSWEALEDSTPDVRKLWLDFEFGGQGVCAIRARDLQK